MRAVGDLWCSFLNQYADLFPWDRERNRIHLWFQTHHLEGDEMERCERLDQDDRRRITASSAVMRHRPNICAKPCVRMPTGAVVRSTSTVLFGPILTY